MTEEEFYSAVADILGSTHVYVQPPSYTRRWGPRRPGNGRYPGHGIIRVHAPDQIYVSLHTPALSGTYDRFDAALEAIQRRVDAASAETGAGV